MAKSLIIAEKPSVARDLARTLGNDFQDYDNFLESDRYVIAWAVGHLLEFLEPEDINAVYKAWKLDDLPILPQPFHYKPKDGAGKLLGTLKKLLNRGDVKEVVNACDAGREGELIFREILEYFEVDKPTLRLWLQSMTPAAIRKGFQELKPGREFDRLGDAAKCRAEADWLIGMNSTRALTKRLKRKFDVAAWSAGRVQTPTLALIVDRELEILAHRPQPFWRIQGTFHASNHDYPGTWFDPKFGADSTDSAAKDDWITDREKLDAILEAVRGQQGLARETRKPSTEIAPPLFDLTSLQREANRRFGYSAKRTLGAAQKLYEGYKLITYPRTDSRCLPDDYRGHVHQVIDQLANGPGHEYRAAAKTLQAHGLRNEKRNFDDSGVSDHFAIIPTTEMAPANLHGDEARIYDLVMRRFLASFYPPATWTRVERITEVAGHSFRTRARYLTEPGWYEVWGKEANEDPSLPPLQPASDCPAQNVDVVPEDDETRPPPRITEARLLSLMEHAGKQVEDDHLSQILSDKGLGTPATRAETIENLIAKQYIQRADRALKATSKGILLIDVLRRIQVQRLASAELTGELEKHLREVEGGKRTRSLFMGEISDYTRDIVERARGFDYDALHAGEPPLGPCPVCKQRQVVERVRFYACEGNTGKDEGACTFMLWKDRNGRYLDRLTVRELLENGQTAQLDGFSNKRGEGYKAALLLTPDGQVQVQGEQANGLNGGDEVALPVSAEPVAQCPFDAECKVFETPTHYHCEERCVHHHPFLKSGAQLPRMVCKREIKREEAERFFASGRTPQIDDFISRYGKPFKAFLVMKTSGRHGFEFPPRAPRQRRGRKGEEAGAAGEALPAAASEGRRGYRKGGRKSSSGAAKSSARASGTKNGRNGAGRRRAMAERA
jgi:DNA topoisomerase-3